MGVPMFAGAGVYFADNIARYLACFLQQSHVGVHLHQFAPGVVTLGNVPTHHLRNQLVSRLLATDSTNDPIRWV